MRVYENLVLIPHLEGPWIDKLAKLQRLSVQSWAKFFSIREQTGQQRWVWTIFWNMTQCSLVLIYEHFGGINRLRFRSLRISQENNQQGASSQ